jgi:hypothetical protein
MLSAADSRTMQLLVLLALALFIGVQAFPLSEVWRRRALMLGAVLLLAALIFTVLAWGERPPLVLPGGGEVA